jgi:flavin reductase (DIM6/NTAB) family NADH-FMN oxidoreductase RutF
MTNSAHTISTDQFRDVLRHFPAGVTLVTTREGEQDFGLTVSAFSSISADPPLIAVTIAQSHLVSELLQAEGASFGVSILAQDQQPLSDRFAFVDQAKRFKEGRWVRAATGAPLLADAVAWLDCSVREQVSAGSHTIIIGAVQASSVPRAEEAPLVYWNRGYRSLRVD